MDDMIDISTTVNVDNEHSVMLTIPKSELKRLKTAKLIGKDALEITVIASLVPAVFDTDDDIFM